MTAEAMGFAHTSVLAEEALEGLRVRPDGVYVDGTLGGGGHAVRVAERLEAALGGRLIGFDQDKDAIDAATRRLEPFSGLVTIIRDNFENAAARLRELKISVVDGILMDLGVSSYQFDAPERGFSYRVDAPLDMRMDREQELTAADIVNGWEERELVRVLRDYGEERYAGPIARRIVRERERQPVRTTGQLNEIVDAAIPARMRAREEGHPARRTYQALRIACNRELDVLSAAMDTLVELLGPGGRFVIITFHSLEDRIVKNRFRSWEKPCVCPPDFPVCVCGRVARGRVVTRKPIVPGEEEVRRNRRARSAKLRVFEKAS